jgi:hypothetical protein
VSFLTRLCWAVPPAAMLILAACGAGSGAGPAPQQLPGIAVGEPSPSAVLDTAPFLAAAQIERCADQGNRLFLIDGKQVYWERSGSCPDNASAQRLFGKTPDQLLCSQVSTLAGPRLHCADAAVNAMFDLILKNSGKADLGLGAGHTVVQLKIPSVGVIDDVAFDTIDRGMHSNVSKAGTAVVRDRAAWEALWRSHAGDTALPAVDFSRNMVIAVFTGTAPDGCHSTEITRLARFDGKLLVTHADTVPGPAVLCTAALVQPAHLIVTERSDREVSFLAQLVVIQ